VSRLNGIEHNQRGEDVDAVVERSRMGGAALADREGATEEIGSTLDDSVRIALRAIESRSSIWARKTGITQAPGWSGGRQGYFHKLKKRGSSKRFGGKEKLLTHKGESGQMIGSRTIWSQKESGKTKFSISTMNK